jgi:hypothetical protein
MNRDTRHLTGIHPDIHFRHSFHTTNEEGDVSHNEFVYHRYILIRFNIYFLSKIIPSSGHRHQQFDSDRRHVFGVRRPFSVLNEKLIIDH